MLPFPIGRFKGAGHWINQTAEGDYTVSYVISAAPEGGSVHTVHRVFLKPDGSTLYEENSTLTFTPSGRNGFRLIMRSAQGEVQGSGYCFDHLCHYDVNIAADNHLECTFSAGRGLIEGLASSTNKGNFTSWKETLQRG